MTFPGSVSLSFDALGGFDSKDVGLPTLGSGVVVAMVFDPSMSWLHRIMQAIRVMKQGDKGGSDAKIYITEHWKKTYTKNFIEWEARTERSPTEPSERLFRHVLGSDIEEYHFHIPSYFQQDVIVIVGIGFGCFDKFGFVAGVLDIILQDDPPLYLRF